MKSKYKEVMDRIEVTEEMRTRILQSIHKEADSSQSAKKAIPFRNWKQITSIAAAIAILVIGAFAYYTISQEPDEPLGVSLSGPVDAGSLEELSDKVGFEVEGLENLPFEELETEYIAYSETSAVVVYKGENQLIEFNKSTDTSGNNGYYETYAIENQIELNGCTITLQGDESGYYLISFILDDYSYTISSDKAQTEEVMRNLVAEIIGN